MIEIFYEKSFDKMVLLVEGHAGAGAIGEDLVCCAVSTLTDSLAYYIENRYELHTVEKSKGKVYIELETIGSAPRAVFNFVITALEGLEKDYPEYIKAHSQMKN